jgi:predicted unusual protein kinase regulating ubiquinone biosynthesis (AarF/ABC1/UbiB family)
MQPAKQDAGVLPLGFPTGPTGTMGESTTPIDIPPARPPARARRMLKAYWVTFVVLSSYLSVRLLARFRSQQALERILLEKHQRNARRIEKAILELQGLFIKVGQLISIMTNFLPREFRQELEGLQDQVPPRPFPDIEQRIRDEFGGKGPAELFAEFAERPIAAASIGQVHVARLPGGEKVAVKVQYPDIEQIARVDLRALRRILSIVQWFAPLQGLEGVYREVRDMILEELDFKAEAQNVRRIAANFKDRADVAFPRVVEELTTARVLTTVWEDGIKIGDLGRLDAAGVDRRKLAALVVEAYCQQIFIDGIYHADPHPGNVLIRRPTTPGAAPAIVFLDFGAVAEVSREMREGMIQLLQGAIHRDTSRIVAAMRKMGFIPRGADDRVFDRVIEYFHQRFQEEIQLDSFSLRDVKLDPDKLFENLADLRRMDISMRELSASFFVPKEWFLLERTLLLLMGLCTALAPELNPMHVIRPYLERFVLGEDQDWAAFVVATTKELALSAVALPGEMRRFLSSAERGELEISFRNVDDAARLVYALGRQAIWVVVAIAAAAFALVFDGRHEPGWAHACAYVSGGAGVLFLLSTWTTRVWLRRSQRKRR